MKTKPETCPDCNGHAMVINSWTGDPDDCHNCDGGWVTVAVRDKRGRFLPEKKKRK